MVTTSINQVSDGDDSVSLKSNEKQVIVKVDRAVDSASGLTFILCLILLCLFTLTYIQITDVANLVKQNNKSIAELLNKEGISTTLTPKINEVTVTETETKSTIVPNLGDTTHNSQAQNLSPDFPLPSANPSFNLTPKDNGG